MQITIPSGGHFLITSKGEHIPIGARIDVAAGSLRYVNAILGMITVGTDLSGNEPVQLREIGLWADDFTQRYYDKSEENLWGKWDETYESLRFDEFGDYTVDEVTLHTSDLDAGLLYDLATHGMSKDEFIDRFGRLISKMNRDGG